MKSTIRFLLSLTALFSAVAAYADAPGVYAITGGTVHRVSGPPIPNGVVIIRNGLIDAVGTNIAVPDEASVIDAKGMHVYPGLFDAHSKLGLPAATSSGASGASASSAPKLTAATRVVDIVNMTDDDRLAKRSTGVTTVLIVPAGEVFNGQSAIINLGDQSLRDSIVRSPAAVHVGFATKSWGNFPDSLMGAIYAVRQGFLDAKRQGEARAIYDRSPEGRERPVIDPALEALEPVVRRTLPVVFAADDSEMVVRALEIGKEANVRTIVTGARTSYEIADELKRRSAEIFVSVDFPKAPARDQEDEPLRLVRRRVLSPTTPMELSKRGVRFALVSGGASAGDFIPGIRKAIRAGLSEADALRAVTLTPAQMLGVDRQLGSIDRGKIANIVVTDKPVFDEKREIVHLLVDGRLVRLAEKEEAASGDSPVAGTWNIEIRMNDRVVSLRVTISGTQTSLTGNYTGDRGSGDLSAVTFENDTLRFSFVEKTSQTGESSEWRFEGRVSGNEIRGNVATTLGTFEFTGSKPE